MPTCLETDVLDLGYQKNFKSLPNHKAEAGVVNFEIDETGGQKGSLCLTAFSYTIRSFLAYTRTTVVFESLVSNLKIHVFL